jgi:archaellum biogenesis ATPase FlaH
MIANAIPDIHLVTDLLDETAERRNAERLGIGRPTDPGEPPPEEGERVEGVMHLGDVRSYYGSVEWLWDKWVPRGHATMLAGPQGTGKSFMAAAMMGTMIGGLSTWPDGQPFTGTPGPVLLVDTESMRGEYYDRMTRLGVPEAVINERVIIPTVNNDPAYILTMPNDLPFVERVAEAHHVSAIVIDSLSGGHTLDENSADMRKILQGLVAIVGRLQCVILVVHHANKRPTGETSRMTLDRVRGSSTITQFCRSVIGLYRPEESDLTSTVRVEPLKASFCEPAKAIGMDISGKGLKFGEAPKSDRIVSKVDLAEEFLKDLLKREPLHYTELLSQAECLGIGKNALYRARDRLGVRAVAGMWTLPLGIAERMEAARNEPQTEE